MTIPIIANNKHGGHKNKVEKSVATEILDSAGDCCSGPFVFDYRRRHQGKPATFFFLL